VFVKSSVGNGPLPTQYICFKNSVYFFDFVRSNSKPVQAPAAVVLDEVTNGYVPKSTSNNEELLHIILIYPFLSLV
jgi:hypothetical protein